MDDFQENCDNTNNSLRPTLSQDSRGNLLPDCLNTPDLSDDDWIEEAATTSRLIIRANSESVTDETSNTVNLATTPDSDVVTLPSETDIESIVGSIGSASLHDVDIESATGTSMGKDVTHCKDLCIGLAPRDDDEMPSTSRERTDHDELQAISLPEDDANNNDSNMADRSNALELIKNFKLSLLIKPEEPMSNSSYETCTSGPSSDYLCHSNVKTIDDRCSFSFNNNSFREPIQDPDYYFFKGILPEVRQLSRSHNELFKREILSLLDSLLREQGIPLVPNE